LLTAFTGESGLARKRGQTNGTLFWNRRSWHAKGIVDNSDLMLWRQNPATDGIRRKTAEYRATVADVVYKGIVDVLKAPDGDRFIVISEHSSDNLIYDPHFLGWDRSPDFILIQVTSTVGNNKDSKLAFFRYVADELKSKLSVRPDDVMINTVFVDRSDWSFGNGDPWV
jgi:hypothetical protein